MFFSLSMNCPSSSSTSRDFNPIKIFSPDFRKTIGIIEIGFNAIASTYVSRFLERIVAEEAAGLGICFVHMK